MSRAVRAALLRRSAYEEVGRDAGAILSALGVVILAGIAIALGLEDVLVVDARDRVSVSGFFDRLLRVWLAVMTYAVGWALWGAMAYLMGSRFLGGRATFNQVLRVLGISYAPGVLFVLMLVPTVGVWVRIVATIWVLVAAVLGVRTVQEIDWFGAVLASLLGWFLFFMLLPLYVLAPAPS